MNKNISAIISAAIMAVVIIPLSAIWALNQLFNTNIAYTFWTWLASLIICCCFSKSYPIKYK